MHAAFPYIALARRDHDFRIVETSTEFPLSATAKEEARWLALDWWGNCFVDGFAGSIGHAISKESRDTFLLMLVQPGPIAPDRFVVFLTANEYSRFEFNPFRATGQGVFDFTETFYRQRDEPQFHVNWKVRMKPRQDILTPEMQRHVHRAEQHLAHGHSLIVPTQADRSELFRECESIANALFQETLRKINVFTFTNTTSDKLDHFGTLLASVYNAAQSRTFSDILQELVSVDEYGSPFRTIRRTENMQ